MADIVQSGVPGALAEQERRHHRYRQQFAQRQPAGTLPDPQAVMIFCQVDQGWRLYASRDIPQARFWQTQDPAKPVDWEATAVMRDMLVITKPTQGECLAELIRLWAARDRAAALESTDDRRAIGR